jgi:membrane protein YqaA with SNARE-associated domain
MLRRLYDWTMAKATHPHAEWWLAAFAFAESSFFPIPPLPLLGLMCLAEPRKAVRFALITTIASVLGGLLGYAIGYFLYDTIGTTLINALGLTENFPRAACALRNYGAEIILVKGVTPIPYKLITITAGFIHLDLFTFIWASVVSRGALFLVVGTLFRIFGAPIKAFIDKYLVWVTGGFILVIIGGFFLASALTGGSSRSDACSGASAAVTTQS